MSALSHPETDTAGSLLVEEKTEYRLDDGDHERLAHYVDKSAILAAAIDGKEAIALCGKRWVPVKDGTRFPVCKTCQEIYEGLPDGGGDGDDA